MKVPIKALVAVIVLLNSGLSLAACSEAQLQKFTENFECGHDIVIYMEHGKPVPLPAMASRPQGRPREGGQRMVEKAKAVL